MSHGVPVCGDEVLTVPSPTDARYVATASSSGIVYFQTTLIVPSYASVPVPPLTDSTRSPASSPLTTRSTAARIGWMMSSSSTSTWAEIVTLTPQRAQYAEIELIVEVAHPEGIAHVTCPSWVSVAPPDAVPSVKFDTAAHAAPSQNSHDITDAMTFLFVASMSAANPVNTVGAPATNQSLAAIVLSASRSAWVVALLSFTAAE